VDDVFTTGATLSEAARTLLRAGASEVMALTLARSLP
ncbi:MAG: ComF family protein, partial [Deltaproteobacteria bacterium]